MPNPTTPTDQATTARLPGFRPQPPPTTDTIDPAVTTTRPGRPQEASQGPQVGSAPVGGDAGPAELPGPPTPTPSPASSESYRQAIAMGLQVGTLAINARLDPAGSRWLPTDEEVEAMAEPLARIAARHSPVTVGGSSDVMDGIEATVAVGGYVFRNIIEAKIAEAAATDVPEYEPAADA